MGLPGSCRIGPEYPGGELATGEPLAKEPHPSFLHTEGEFNQRRPGSCFRPVTPVFSDDTSGGASQIAGAGLNPRCFPRKEPHPTFTRQNAKFQGPVFLLSMTIKTPPERESRQDIRP